MSDSELTKFGNCILSDLKSSYSAWEDVVTKSNKFHSALKNVSQASTSFFDAVQHVAELSVKTNGGSQEIGNCLKQLCLKQRGLEAQLRSISNHLLSTVSSPLSTKLDEWKRNVAQIEKDHNPHSKRTRAELKKAISEYNRCQKKANRLGVGVTIAPESSSQNKKVAHGAIQAAAASKELKLKTDAFHAVELARIRSLMLEDRKRYCFFASCLLPVLECELTILRDISVLEEIVHFLSKLSGDSSKLLPNAESIIEKIFSRTVLFSTIRSPSDSGATVSCADLSENGTDFLTGSSDSDSGHLTMERAPSDVRSNPDLDRYSLSSTNRSPFTQTHQDSTTMYPRESVCSRIRCISAIGDFESVQSPGGLDDDYGVTKRVFATARPGYRIQSCYGDELELSKTFDSGDQQGSTLRSSTFGRTSVTAFSPQHNRSSDLSDTSSTPTPDIDRVTDEPDWSRRCFNNANERSTCDDTDTDCNDSMEDSSVTRAVCSTADAGDYVQVHEETAHHNRSSNVTSPFRSVPLTYNNHSSNELFARHTISVAYDHSTGMNARNSISNLFSTSICKSNSKDSGVDSTTVLYPNQGIPPPVYTNLNQLADAAKRKFSLGTGSSTEIQSPNALEPFPSVDSEQLLTRVSVVETQLSPFLSNSADGNVDPYSEEMDVLERVGGTATSQSTLTSSTTNESHHSSLEVNLATSVSSELSPRSLESDFPLVLAHRSLDRQPVLPAPPPPPPPLWDTAPDAAATLMSELSEQLRQFTNGSLANRPHDAYLDLPPPPSPDATFDV